MEFRWALIAMIGVMVLGTLKGILVVVVVSLVGLIVYTNRRPVYVLGRKPGTTSFFRPLSAEHPEDETFPGLLLKLEGNVHFANASRPGEQIWPLVNEYRPRVLVLDCSAMPDLEYTALKMLTEAEVKLREALGRERMLYSLKHVIEEYQRLYGEATSRKD